MKISDPVRRVAKALIDDDPTMFGYHESHIKSKESAARAAIAAMRDPSYEMIEAGDGAKFELSSIFVWQAMIDKALG